MAGEVQAACRAVAWCNRVAAEACCAQREPARDQSSKIGKTGTKLKLQAH